jgi:hypothetical protein
MGDLRIPVALISIPVLAYGLAWNFFDQFFWYFGIELRTLSILPEHYFAWGTVIFVWTILSRVDPGQWTDFIPHVFGSLALASMLIPKEKMALLRRVAIVLATGLFVLSVFTKAGRLGQEEAAERSNENYRVELALSGPSDEEGANARADANAAARAPEASAWTTPEAGLRLANEAGGLRLIWQDRDATVVGAFDPEKGSWTIFRVQTEKISVTRSSGVQ